MRGTGKRSILQPGSADLQSAVSPNCIRQRVGQAGRPQSFERAADCKSAIFTTSYVAGIANLRYGNRACAGVWRFLLLTGLTGIAAQPASLWACSACYGASDSPMAK